MTVITTPGVKSKLYTNFDDWSVDELVLVGIKVLEELKKRYKTKEIQNGTGN